MLVSVFGEDVEEGGGRRELLNCSGTSGTSGRRCFCCIHCRLLTCTPHALHPPNSNDRGVAVYGTLGYGSTTQSTIPVTVLGGYTFQAGSITATYYHACALLVNG